LLEQLGHRQEHLGELAGRDGDGEVAVGEKDGDGLALVPLQPGARVEAGGLAFQERSQRRDQADFLPLDLDAPVELEPVDPAALVEVGPPVVGLGEAKVEIFPPFDFPAFPLQPRNHAGREFEPAIPQLGFGAGVAERKGVFPSPGDRSQERGDRVERDETLGHEFAEQGLLALLIAPQVDQLAVDEPGRFERLGGGIFQEHVPVAELDQGDRQSLRVDVVFASPSVARGPRRSHVAPGQNEASREPRFGAGNLALLRGGRRGQHGRRGFRRGRSGALPGALFAPGRFAERLRSRRR